MNTNALLNTSQLSPEMAADKLRQWQEGNILTTVRQGDSVLVPIHDTERRVTEYLWFKVTSKINLKWITGTCLSIPEKVMGMIQFGHPLTFRRTKIMSLDPVS